MSTNTQITSRPISGAFDAIPGYPQAAEMGLRLDRWQVPAAGAAFDARQELRVAAATSDEFPVSLIERTAGHAAQETARQTLLHALIEARTQARHELSRIVADGRGHALAYLGDRLKEVIAAVRTAEHALPEGATIEDAVAAGTEAVDAWRTLDAAVDAYGEIRRLQFDLYATGGVTPPAVTIVDRHLEASPTFDRKHQRAWWSRCGLIREHLDLDAAWVSRRAVAAGAEWRYSPDTGRNRWCLDNGRDWIDPAPKPGGQWLRSGSGPVIEQHRRWLLSVAPPTWRLPAGSWWPLDSSRHDYLRWLAANATPWVPTPQQLREAEETASAAIAPPGPVLLRSALSAPKTSGAVMARIAQNKGKVSEDALRAAAALDAHHQVTAD